jgi:hypothetical protein
LCRYFSGIITQKGEVYWLKTGIDPMSHETIKAAYKLTDKDEGNKYVLFEITPKNHDQLLTCKTWSEIKAEDWQFKIDNQTVPEWFEKKCVEYTAKAFEAWNQSILIHLLPGNETIEALREGGYIAEMWGTSKVGVMYETSQVGEMRGTSQVGVMRGTSQVGVMYETSKVGEMRGTSQVGEMRGTSQVGVMYETSKVGVMYEPSKVGVMRAFASAVKNSKLYTAKDAVVVQAGCVA